MSVCFLRHSLATSVARRLYYTTSDYAACRCASSIHNHPYVIFRELHSSDFDTCSKNLLLGFSINYCPRFFGRQYHLSQQVLKAANSNAKFERLKFEDIQVVGPDGQSLGKMKRFQAEQLAQDKALKLVLITPASESQPIPQYRLMTSLEYRTEAKFMKQAKRLDKSPEAKTLKLSVSIAEHDLNIKVSYVVEWLQSGHSVKVIIISSHSKTSSGDDVVFNKIVSATKELATIKQARKTASQMTFHLIPKSMMSTSSPDDSVVKSAESDSTGNDKNQKLMKTQELKKLRDAADAKALNKTEL